MLSMHNRPMNPIAGKSEDIIHFIKIFVLVAVFYRSRAYRPYFNPGSCCVISNHCGFRYGREYGWNAVDRGRQGPNYRYQDAGHFFMSACIRMDTIREQIAIVDKRRDQPNVAEVHHVIGDVEGRTALIVDDIVDTAGTLTKVAEAIKVAGAREVIASCSHAVLSGHALERLEKSPLSKLIITDSMPLDPAKRQSEKIEVLSIAELLARAIKNIHEETSVTSLFV